MMSKRKPRNDRKNRGRPAVTITSPLSKAPAGVVEFSTTEAAFVGLQTAARGAHARGKAVNSLFGVIYRKAEGRYWMTLAERKAGAPQIANRPDLLLWLDIEDGAGDLRVLGHGTEGDVSFLVYDILNTNKTGWLDELR